MANKRTIDAARTYAARGWRVLPLRARSKAPAVKRGWHDASADSAQIAAWFQATDFGVAIATLGDLLVVDVDPRSGGDETLGALEMRFGRLPDTPRVNTGRGDGGTHHYFRLPALPEGTALRAKLGDGLDVKALGGYVVAPPTPHPDTGRPYTWDAGADLTETPIAEAPAWLVRALSEQETTAPLVALEGCSATDTILGSAFAAAGMLGAELQSGCISARCPWLASHTDGRGDGHDSSCAILPPTSRKKYGAFRCLHSHCEHRAYEDVLRQLPADAVRAAFARHNLMAPEWLGGSKKREGITGERTDLRNAERMVEWHGADLRYLAAWKKWVAWDSTRWVGDDAGQALRAASDTARRLLAIAVKAQTRSTERLAKATSEGAAERIAEAEKEMKRTRGDVGHAVQSQSAKKIQAMVDLAQAFPEIAARHADVDADPMALNVRNGTLDLRTGELRAHRRSDLIMRLAPVDYDAKARAPTFERFVRRAMGDSSELVDYLQRLIGYALTGLTTEHVLAFFYGATGNNGKSTFLNLFHAMLGDYATPAARNLLFRSRGERHPTELASLHGRRFVTCSEVEEGQAFDESLVKDLTGGDPIECRRMREDFWTFRPTHTLFLAGNHKPVVRGDDGGIWRRIRLVPWTVTIPEGERDAELPAKLQHEAPGVLAWAVEGCLSWQRRGLGAPLAVTTATSAYRGESDLLGSFFRERCVFEPDAAVSRAALRESYENQCREMGQEPYGARRFAGRLRELSVTETTVRVASGTGRSTVRDAWRGVRLLTENERLAAVRPSAAEVNAS